MDVQSVAKQLINYLGDNPQLIQQFIQHPYSTTATAIGTDERISKKDMSEVVTAAAAMSNNQKLSMGDVANIASLLLGQNHNSVHELTSMLFGGGNTQQATATAQAQTTSNGKLNLGSLVSMALLASTLMSAYSKRQQQQQAAAQQQAAQQQAAQPAAAAQQAAAAAAAAANKPSVNLADGLDLGEIAMLAGQFLGNSAAAQQQSQPVTLNNLPQTQPQAQAGNIDFATIAQIASQLLKR